jgi:drug/metabolite transporter (DMT)-like permease
MLQRRLAPLPVIFLILACALWGLSFPVVKALHLEQAQRLPGIGSEFLSAWIQTARFGLGTLVLLPFLSRKRLPSRLEIRQGMVLAFWGGAGMALQADGLAHTDAFTSAFLTQAYCVILPLLTCLRLRRAPDFRTIAATLLVLAGCAILSGMKPGDLKMGRGELATILAALLFTFQILALENPAYRTNRGLPVTFVMCLAIAVMLLPAVVLTAPAPIALLDAGASWPALGLVAVLALFCSVGAFLLMNHWQPRISATEAGLIYTTEPVFAALYVMFLPQWLGHMTGSAYPNEHPGFPLLAGGGMILAANLLMQIKRKPHKPAIAPAP